MGRWNDWDDPNDAERPEDSLARAWPDSGLARRDLLRSASAASMVLASVAARPAAAADPAPAGRFLTAAELALLDELSEIILPADDHAPGARAAKVAAEIDRALADAPGFDREAAERRRQWREGLALVDQLARRMTGTDFLAAPPDKRLAVVTAMAAGEARPQKPEERFFVQLKGEVARAYYISEIGVRQESEYKGNGYLQEFAGQDAATVPLRRRNLPRKPGSPSRGG
jgi:hypothetical protein